MRLHSKLVAALFVSSALLTPSICAAGTETFTYDALGRVSFVVAESGATRTYTYDNADNLIQITLGNAFASAADVLEAGRAKLASRNPGTVVNTPGVQRSGRQSTSQPRVKSNLAATAEVHRSPGDS